MLTGSIFKQVSIFQFVARFRFIKHVTPPNNSCSISVAGHGRHVHLQGVPVDGKLALIWFVPAVNGDRPHIYRYLTREARAPR